MRILLGIAGAGLAAWGAWLLLPQITVELLAWLGGGVVLHDFLVAPLVGASGLIVKRASIGIGLVTTGIVAILAVPLLWRQYGEAKARSTGAPAPVPAPADVVPAPPGP